MGTHINEDTPDTRLFDSAILLAFGSPRKNGVSPGFRSPRISFPSSRNRLPGLLLTLKALYNKAQGRGAPWVRNERNATNLNGVEHASNGMNPRHAGHSPRDMAIHVVGPRWGQAHRLAVDPGCAAFAATLGFVVKPFHGDKHRCAAFAATALPSHAIVLQRDNRTHTMRKTLLVVLRS